MSEPLRPASSDPPSHLPEICQLVLEQITDTAIVYADRDGAIRGWNAGARALLGYESKDVIGQHLSCLYTKSDRLSGKVLQGLEAAAARGRFDEDALRLRQDGEPVPAHTTITAVRDRGGAMIGYAVVLRDTAAERQMEQALHDSERRFRTLVSGVAECAICMLDRDGVVTSWNFGAERITGYPAEEIVGKPVAVFYTEDDCREGKPQQALRVAAATGRCEDEGQRLRRCGTPFLAHVVIDAIQDESGRVVGYAKIMRDVTTQQRTAQALRESQTRYQVLLESITDHAICTLDPTGIVTSWNAGAERIAGYAADQIIGEHFSIFYLETERNDGRPYRALDVARSAGRHAEEGTRVRKDGSRFAAEIVISPIRGDRGEITGFAKVTRDISERKQREFAESASAAKSRFLAHLSHELRTPLNAIIGFSELIKSEVLGQIANKQYVSYGADIHSSGQHLLDLVNDILDLSRVESGKIEPQLGPVDPKYLAERTFRVLGTKAMRKKIELKVGKVDDVAGFMADERMVYQCLVNLVDNAIKFSTAGTAIVISASRDAAWVRLSVTDHGVGMAEEDIPTALLPFRQLDNLLTRTSEGAGIGLALVKSYCEVHGGGIAIRSAPGKGTEVTLRFPYPGDKKHKLVAV
jgi:PAS domain S-box-containing protein